MNKYTVYLEAAAVIISAIAGMIRAAEKRMDIVGVLSLAMLMAFAGGTIRDLLLERRPFFWIKHEEYLFIILIMGVAFVYMPKFFMTTILVHRRSNTIDAMGLAFFSLSGLTAAIAAGVPFLPATLIGVITGVAGGVFRDIVVNEIPVIFRPGSLYAIASFIGCWLFIAGKLMAIADTVCFIFAFLAIVFIRLGSLFFGITLPHPFWIRKEQDPKP